RRPGAARARARAARPHARRAPAPADGAAGDPPGRVRLADRRGGRAARRHLHEARGADGRAEGALRPDRPRPEPGPRPARVPVVRNVSRLFAWVRGRDAKTPPPSKGRNEMASLKDAVNLTTQLNELTQQLHSELTEGDVDFEKMVRLSDEISEHADSLASAFTRVNEA